MYIKPELLSKYEELKRKYPHLDNDLVMDWFEEMPEEALMVLEEYETKKEYGCHIVTKKQYEYYTSKLPSVKWTVEEIVKASGIDFDTKPYYEYDFAFLMNYLYSRYSSFMTDASYFVKIVKATLENPLVDNADDTAYHMAKELK